MLRFSDEVRSKISKAKWNRLVEQRLYAVTLTSWRKLVKANKMFRVCEVLQGATASEEGFELVIGDGVGIEQRECML